MKELFFTERIKKDFLNHFGNLKSVAEMEKEFKEIINTKLQETSPTAFAEQLFYEGVLAGLQLQFIERENRCSFKGCNGELKQANKVAYQCSVCDSEYELGTGVVHMSRKYAEMVSK